MWEYETEEGAHDLYMDTGEEIRFRVVDESFVDTSPSGPSSAEAASSSEELPKKEAPYTLVVRCPDVLPKHGDCDGRTQLREGRAPPCVLMWVPLLEPRPRRSGRRPWLCGLGQWVLPGTLLVVRGSSCQGCCGGWVRLSPAQKRETEPNLDDKRLLMGLRRKKLRRELGSQSKPQGGVTLRAVPPNPVWA